METFLQKEGKEKTDVCGQSLTPLYKLFFVPLTSSRNSQVCDIRSVLVKYYNKVPILEKDMTEICRPTLSFLSRL